MIKMNYLLDEMNQKNQEFYRLLLNILLMSQKITITIYYNILVHKFLLNKN